MQASSPGYQGCTVGLAVNQTGDGDEAALLKDFSRLRRRIHAWIDSYFVDSGRKGESLHQFKHSVGCGPRSRPEAIHQDADEKNNDADPSVLGEPHQRADS